MAEALAIQVKSERQRTPLRLRFRWAFQRTRARILPRRWVIQWEMGDNSRYFARAIAEAKARKASRDDLEGLRAEEAHCYWELEEERAMLESYKLTGQAGSYMLPTPELRATDDDPNWQLGTTFKQSWYLKPQAMQELRTQIRAERKARREPLGEWLKIVGATIGGIGGAIILVDRVIKLLR